MASRRVVLLVALGLLVAGLTGTVAYLRDYAKHRGFVAVKPIPGARPGRLTTVTFFSWGLRRNASYQVYLPAGYTVRRHYPVVYLLHGAPGSPAHLTSIGNAETRLENLIEQGRVPPMMLVFPDGRINGDSQSDSEWANTPTAAMESYVIDVVHDVDRRFSTIAERSARVIGGLSEGGYGAINVALHHLDLFGGLEVWSGYFLQTKTGVFAKATHAVLAYNSPLDYAPTLQQQLAKFPLKAFLYVGAKDPSVGQIAPMAAALKAAGAAVGYAIYAGGHDWQLWNAHLNEMLIVAGRDANATVPARRHAAGSPHASRAPPRRLLLGLLLALISAALINFGFLLQHRGLVDDTSSQSGLTSQLARTLRNPSWLAGQAIGSLGFALQIAAVALSLLSLVQAFAAGGMALSVPLAAWVFGYRMRWTQVLAVFVIAAGLSVLPLGLAPERHAFRAVSLVLTTGGISAIAVLAAAAGTAPLRALAAGLFYGAADAAIKAAFLSSAHRGSAVLPLEWVGVAALTTAGGFVAFQAALRTGRPVASISLMNASAAVAALASGVIALGESLGRSPTVMFAHLGVIGLVLACIPVLATAQSEITSPGQSTADGEEQALNPDARPGVPGREHGGQPEVAGQRVRRVGTRGEHHRAQRERQHAASHGLHARQRHSGHRAGEQPGRHQTAGRLAVEP
ncbi:MAG: hypothetical protein JO262_02545, partial [Solirubrobacterales bacterium]|nr:hypothetical protein [Solirubrobacterales bacterium]